MIAREYTRGARGAVYPGAPNNVETHPRPEPTPEPQRRARGARAGYGAVGGCRRMLRAAEPVTALPGDGPGEPEPEPEPPHTHPGDAELLSKTLPLPQTDTCSQHRAVCSASQVPVSSCHIPQTDASSPHHVPCSNSHVPPLTCHTLHTDTSSRRHVPCHDFQVLLLT